VVVVIVVDGSGGGGSRVWVKVWLGGKWQWLVFFNGSCFDFLLGFLCKDVDGSGVLDLG
jgi:hypothetical protein